eukprot:TRINITY_DN4063_c0_g1_i1.p1 TRINITY_DN4063_c0_g1~~TRINITY_DN4063_c0_g1_i1.p1  ORF type:complete len:1698 (+),score=235.63 TRINITY_DN4063_c0_g1_i1:90-5183(+)
MKSIILRRTKKKANKNNKKKERTRFHNRPSRFVTTRRSALREVLTRNRMPRSALLVFLALVFISSLLSLESFASPDVDLRIFLDDGGFPVIAGSHLTYTIDVVNYGPSDAPSGSLTVIDYFPSRLGSIYWVCSNTPNCTNTGYGNITDGAVTLSYLGSVRYVVTAQVLPSVNSSIANQASIATDIAQINSTDTSNDITQVTSAIMVIADLSITKTDSPASVKSTAGTGITYQVEVYNLGPSECYAGYVNVRDAFSIYHTSTYWVCSAYNAICGTSSGFGVLNDYPYLPPGGSLLYSLSAKIVGSAIGNLTNTASVTSLNADPNLANNVATDSNILDHVADVSINVTDLMNVPSPGTILTYYLTVVNNGPSHLPLNSVSVEDVFPSVYLNPAWTCVTTSVSCTSGSGPTLVDFPVIAAGGTVVYTITGSILSSATGNMTNTAKVVVYDGAGVFIEDIDTSNNIFTDYDLLLPKIDLITLNDDRVLIATPGLSVTYLINITNNGPSDALVGSFQVVDDLSIFCSSTWTCTALTPTALCGTPSGSGSIVQQPKLLVNDRIAYKVTAKVCSSSTGTLGNIVSATALFGHVDPTPVDAIYEDNDFLYPVADVSITKTDNLYTSAPGSPFTYVIEVTNFGPSDIPVSRMTVTDSFPPSMFILPISWTCSAIGGVCGSAGASTDINDTPALTAGGKVTYKVFGSARPDLGSVTLINWASAKVQGGGAFFVTDNVPNNNRVYDNTTLIPASDLSVSKNDNKLVVGPGQIVTYTIDIKNLGPSDTLPLAVNVTDFFNVKFQSYTWDCTCSVPVLCSFIGSISGTNTPIIFTAGFPVLSTMRCTATATIMNGGISGAIDNILSADLTYGGADPILTNNNGLDRDGFNSTADVFVTITDGVNTAIPGSTVTYTILIGNKGPANIDIQSDPTTAMVSWIDFFPSIITSFSWRCIPIASTGPEQPRCDSGIGDPGSFDPNFGGFVYTQTYLPVGTSINFYITAKIASAATGSLDNPFKALLFFSINDYNLNDNLATDSDVLTPQADLKVDKFILGGGIVPGRLNTFVIRVSNLGPSDNPQVQVSDVFPPILPDIDSIQCIGTSPSFCGTVTQATVKSLVASSNVKAGSSVEYFIVFIAPADYAGDPNCIVNNTNCVVNTATVVSLTNSVETINTADDVCRLEAPITRKIGYSVVKTGPSFIPLFGRYTYTITVTNSGPSVYPGTFGDDIDPLISPTDDSITWSCSQAGGAVCGPIKDTDSSTNFRNNFILPIGGSLTYTLVTSLAKQLSDRTLVTNIAFVEPNDGESQTLGVSQIYTDGSTYNIDLSKSVSPTTAYQGDKIVWTVVVKRNSGDDSIVVLLTDDVPSSCSSPTWDCSGSNCPSSSGSGSISKLPIEMSDDGDKVTFDISCTASTVGDMKNTAFIRLSGYNKGSSTASATVSVSPPRETVTPTPSTDEPSCYKCLDNSCVSDPSNCKGDLKKADGEIQPVTISYTGKNRNQDLVIPIRQSSQQIGFIRIPARLFPNNWTVELTPSTIEHDDTSSKDGCHKKTEEQASPAFDLIVRDSRGREREVSNLPKPIYLSLFAQVTSKHTSSSCVAFAKQGDKRFQCLDSDTKVHQTHNSDVFFFESTTDHLTSFAVLFSTEDNSSCDSKVLWIVALSLVAFAIAFVLAVGMTYIFSSSFRALVMGFDSSRTISQVVQKLNATSNVHQ